jgi:nicotinamidase/pyrazinamidase
MEYRTFDAAGVRLPLRYDRQHSALLVVDVQPDFLPGGALPVHQGDQVLDPIRRLLNSDLFPLCVATQDWRGISA